MNLICDGCGNKFVLRTVNNSSVFIDNIYYDVTWFCCPGCGKVYVVGMYDETCNNIKAAMEIKRHKVKKYLDAGNKAKAESTIKLIQAKADKLSRRVTRIMSTYHGTFTSQASENNKQELIYLP